jgi:LAS superfamily LD-carboxypeptidase LdcB
MLEKSELLGQFNPANHPDFVLIEKQSTEETKHYLRKEAAHAWEGMHQKANEEGVELKIVSSTRNFERQKQIWENKWLGRSLTQNVNLAQIGLNDFEKAERILKYSAMPGTSRHHWGTDIDINSVEEDFFETEEGEKLYLWLINNAHTFGFFQPYTMKGKNRPTGYEEEPWHWSYAPLSNVFLKEYLASISYSDIHGFEGAETAKHLEVIEHFVCGIASHSTF